MKPIFTPADQFIIYLGNVFCFSGAFLCWVFCAYYWVMARWWKSETGAHLMALTGGMGLILTYVSVRIVRPVMVPTKTDLIIRAVIFGIEAILAGWRLSILMRTQTKRRGHIGNRKQKDDRPRGRHTG